MFSLLQKLMRTPAFEEYEISKIEDGKYLLSLGDKQYQADFVKDKFDTDLWRLKSIERIDDGDDSRFESLKKLWEIKDRRNRSVIGAAMIGWLKPNEIFEQLRTQSTLAEKKRLKNPFKRIYKIKPLPADTRLIRQIIQPTEQTQLHRQFSDPLNMFKAVSRPTAWEVKKFHLANSRKSGPHGQEKRVDKRGAQSIQLKLRKFLGRFSDQQIRQNRYALRLLSPYQSICPCVIVDRNTVLAPDGGKDVYCDIIDEGKKISISQYKGFCKDMMKAHAREIYFGDIKNPNFVIKSDTDPVMLIDLDCIATFDLLQDQKNHPEVYNRVGKNKYRPLTPAYTTRKLIAGREKKIPEDADKPSKQKLKREIKQMNRAGDEYALLLCMLEATCSKDANIELDPERFNQFGVLAGDEFNHNIRVWVVNNIMPQHQEAVRKFLKDPAKYPLPNSLYKVIKWK
ncbi:hypothetical protein D5018_02525 [Parashewanella curva]|uniref:Protein kinase domain-containing protein n=1 Tax=Parashewanella curva TaxID=2338552 RepID=A0A3L8Q1M2_9GAMM|nr:hypothetical protein [Parashewanella curva]RLV61370.1 hypothetical protein D5018_02525 [Parashewanella curva]